MLSSTQQKCANGVAKAAGGVAKTLLQSARKCLKQAEAGKVDLDRCVAELAGTKAGKSMSRTAKAASGCDGGVSFGYLDATSTNFAAQRAALSLLKSALGVDMNLALEEVPSGTACRAAVMKTLPKLLAAKVGVFLACEKAGLAGDPDPFVSADDLAHCLDAVVADERGKIGKAAMKLAGAVASACTASSPLTGACAAAVEPSACLEARADCSVCGMFAGMAGFDRSCDEFDDGAVNGSCP